VHLLVKGNLHFIAISACETYYTKTAHAAVFLRMNPLRFVTRRYKKLN